jgi:hypothetical protein
MFLYIIVGLMALSGAIAGMMVVIPLIGPAGRKGEGREALTYLGEAVGLGRVGEEVAGGEGNDSSPFEAASRLPKRQVVEWRRDGTVLATTRYRRPFYGQVMGRLRRGELLIRREKGCPIRVRQP